MSPTSTNPATCATGGSDTTPRPIRVLLADDHEIMRAGLARILEDVEDITVVGQATGGLEALSMTAELEPDVLMLDFSMPDLDGTEVTAKLEQSHPDVKIVVLTMHENIHYVLKAMEAGASGYIVKADAPSELEKAIRAVHGGRSYITERLQGAVASHLRTPRGNRVGLAKLSPREFQLLRLVVRGLNLQQAAEAMRITESTASTYRKRLLDKLGVENNAQLMRFALENGIDE